MSFAEGDALDAFQFAIEERVGLILHEPRNIAASRAAMRWIVLEAAILGRIVRWRDDDAVREPHLPPAIVL